MEMLLDLNKEVKVLEEITRIPEETRRKVKKFLSARTR